MTTAEQARERLWASRNWQLYWLATSISTVGDSFFEITVMLWVVTVVARGQSWAPAAASGALIAAAGPYLVLGPVAGVFVDRWNRRRILLTADGCRCVLIGSLLLLPLAADDAPRAVKLAVIYAVVAAESSFAQFFNPTKLALLGLVVPEQQLAQASGQIQAAGSLATILGPPLAGTVLFTAGVQWALIADAVSFAVSFAAIRAIRLPSWGTGQPPAEHSRFSGDFREGLRFVARSRVVLTVIVTVCAATLGTGALNSVEVFFVTGSLHVAATWLGFLLGAYGVGSIAGNLIGGQVAARLGTPRTFSLGIAAAGVILIVFALMTAFWAATIVLTAGGLAIGAANAAAPPLILQATPQQMMGRMSAVFFPSQQLASIVSMATAGLLASTVLRGARVVIGGVTFGPITAIIAAGGILILLAGAWSLVPLHAATQATTQSPVGSAT